MIVHRIIEYPENRKSLSVEGGGSIHFRAGNALRVYEYEDSFVGQTEGDTGAKQDSQLETSGQWLQWAGPEPSALQRIITVPLTTPRLTVYRFNAKHQLIQRVVYEHPQTDEVRELVDLWAEEDAAWWKAQPMPDNCKYVFSEGDDD